VLDVFVCEAIRKVFFFTNRSIEWLLVFRKYFFVLSEDG
jgi:hypothetical protein